MKGYQHKLFPYAYNILGSVEDAKDSVQEVLAKFHIMDKSHIINETGYLIKAVTNQSINIKKRNQKIVGKEMWLPEPISTQNADDSINSQDIISYSLLVLLERLTARERAVFILKNAFDYSHKEIATVIDSTVENSRKILSRSTKKISNSNLETNTIIKPSFMEDYIKVIKNGDVIKLEKLLSKDISISADGGGQINVVSNLTTGNKGCSNLLLYVYKTFQTQQNIKISQVNHHPALLFYENNKLVNCQVFEISNNKITNIFSVLAPRKLNLHI